MSNTLLVIPHHNDVARLAHFLPELLLLLPSHFSILVSDDGSTAEQKAKLSALLKEIKPSSQEHSPTLLPPLFTEKNTGKGGAVHRGWKLSEGFSALAFTDADGAVSAVEILRTEQFLRSEECIADALFASRVKMLGRSIDRSLLRHLFGRVFATLVSSLTHLPVYDTQCGLKILKKEAYQKIRHKFSTQGFAFDVELLILLKKSGSVVVEFPVDWHDVPGSKVHLLRDSFRMAWEVFCIQRRAQAHSNH